MSDVQSARFDKFLSRVHEEVVYNRSLGFTGYSTTDSQNHIYFGTCVDENNNVIGHRVDDVIKYNNGRTISIDDTQAIVGDLEKANYAFDLLEGIHYYYHKYDCKEMLDSTITDDGFYETNNGLGYAFSSAKEAAASGALPCPYCCE